ncbi:hypothetical protein, partial [Mycoplasma phocimorsus]|uniref:hypothetical protein n=1 Tax=Mycoplasma phocimorsus TaxID=3045839 RepID=UPI0024C0DBCF
EKHYETAKKAVGIANKLFQIVLGGTIDSNILRDIKDEAASIAYDYASDQWVFIKGAEILADIVLDIQEYIMQKSRDAHKESALNATWNSKGKIWTQEQYIPQKKDVFANRNFRKAIGWVFAMFYKNEKNGNGGIHKYVKGNINTEADNTQGNDCDIWKISIIDKDNINTKLKNIKDANNKNDVGWQEVIRAKYEDFIYFENDKAKPAKKRKFEVLKSFAAKNGLFDAVVKTLQLISNWDNKNPEQRAQELVNITVGATAAIAKIVKNLKS